MTIANSSGADSTPTAAAGGADSMPTAATGGGGSMPTAATGGAGSMTVTETSTGGGPTAAETVSTMLTAAGLPAAAAEVRGLAATYPDFRAAVDELYSEPAARYAEPALRFDAQPVHQEWGR